MDQGNTFGTPKSEHAEFELNLDYLIVCSVR